MHSTPHTVACELLQHCKALLLDLAFHSAAQLRNRCSCSSELQRLAKCRAGAIPQPAGSHASLADHHRHRRIGNVAIQLRRDVDLQNITIAQHSASWHAMYRFFIHADAVESRKIVRELRPRPCPLRTEELRPYLIKLSRGHPRTHAAAHVLQRLPDELPNPRHPVQVGL